MVLTFLLSMEALKVGDEELFKRDAIGISEVDNFEIEVIEDSNFIGN